MLNRLFGPNTHTFLHVLGLCGIASGIPFNKVVMSVSMLFIVLNLLLEANFKSYWSNIKSNKIYWLIFAFFGLHVIGVLWSTNLTEAFHDLKVKLPLLVIPTILAAKPLLVKKHLNTILACFVLSTLLISFINFALYQHWIGDVEYADIRGMSMFSSHVRFALLISMAAAILLSFMARYRNLFQLTIVGVVVWFTFYTFYSQVITGVLTLSGVFVFFVTVYFWKRNKAIAISFFSVITVSSISLIIWLFTPIIVNPADYTNLAEFTKEGNPYKHFFDFVSPETGKPIYLYICEEELDRDWQNYSTLSIHGNDKKGQPIKQTAIRYLASMDLTKDAVGLSKLTQKDISNIEEGNASSKNYGIMVRLYGIKYQLNNESNPNGHSLLERIEYWTAGIDILSSNYLTGVGTGDVQDTFNSYYIENNSPLTPENRHRAHNMYLTIFLTFGILGISLFIWMHIGHQ